MSETQAPIDRFVPGAVVDDFQIVEQIGSGGLSRVYRARQRSLDREVALKVTAHRSGDGRVGAEGRVMAALRHENIASVYTEVVTDGYRLLAMQLVDGPPLTEVIAALHGPPDNVSGVSRWSEADCWNLVRTLAGQASGERTSAERTSGVRQLFRRKRGDVTTFACRLVRQLALALQHTHEQGVYHCDVKPANVLLTRDARPLLTDFNVSARRPQRADGRERSCDCSGETQAAQTTDAPMGGTLPYMAPEQLAAICGIGSPARIDGRADVYSLGLVLFELVTGSWPFAEADIRRDPLLAPRQLYASRLAHPVEFPRAGARLPASVQKVIRHCLQPAAGNRYQSAGELADDLQRVLDRRPLRWAEPLTVMRRAVSAATRHGRAALGTATVMAAMVSVLAGIIREQPNERPLVENAVQNLSSLDEVARRAEADRLERAGREALAGKRFEDAVADLQQAVVLAPRHAAAQHNLGIALFRTRRFAEAAAAFDAAMTLGVRNGRVLSYRAATRLALGDTAGAEADFERARRLATQQERVEIEANYQQFVARHDRPD